jgi:hypothetical protein
MKKLIVVLLLVVSGSLLCAQEAFIREITGTVEILSPGETIWKAAETGRRISSDTVISTGYRSLVRISLGNSTLLVRPLTRLSLMEIQNLGADETVDLYLHTGRIRAEVTPPSNGKTDFHVRSPIATASVRGTSFEFDGLNLQVDEGRILMRGGDGAPGYVWAGHRVTSDPWTGRTTGAAETIKAEITSVPLQAASGDGIPAPAVIIPHSFDAGYMGVDVSWD